MGDAGVRLGRGRSVGRTAESAVLRRLAAGLDADPRHASLSPEQRRLRLFDGITAALGRRAAVRPLLLAFDDLQWSDAASNELLRYLLIHLPAVPLVVVGTYRDE